MTSMYLMWPHRVMAFCHSSKLTLWNALPICNLSFLSVFVPCLKLPPADVICVTSASCAPANAALMSSADRLRCTLSTAMPTTGGCGCWS